MWTLQGTTWYRWAAPPVTRIQDLQDWWIRSQQWTAIQGDALKMLEDVGSQQVYFYRGNAWGNAQSTGDFAAPPVQPPPQGASGPASAPVGGEQEAVPSGVRVVLALPSGPVTSHLMVRTTL